jgi:thiol-disulfide isomerase/thioredoxin
MLEDSMRPLSILPGLALLVSIGFVGDVADAQARARGWLGIAMEPRADGILVGHVIRSSPADRAGIRDGDRVVRVAAQDVSSPREVIQLLATRSAGDLVPVVLSRAGHEMSLSVTLAAFPAPEEMLRMDHLGASAPAWAGIEPVGSAPASLAALRGRVVLLDFWATWCGPCRELAPELSTLQARYGAQGLSVVGITTDSAEAAATFQQRVDMRYAIEVDPKGETSRTYGVSSLPTLFVLDKDGVVRDLAVGFDPSSGPRLEALVKTLLAQPAANPTR